METGVDTKVCRNARCKNARIDSVNHTSTTCKLIIRNWNCSSINIGGCRIPEKCQYKNLHILRGVKRTYCVGCQLGKFCGRRD